MAFLTSWIFWVLLGAIIVVIAIIGYLAENKENQNKTSATNTPIPPTPNNVAETLWSDKAPKPDERKETIHTVTNVDDWANMPTLNSTPPKSTEFIQFSSPDQSVKTTPATEHSAIQPELVQEIQPDINNESEDMFPDIKPSDLEPLPNKQKEEETTPETTTAPPQTPVENVSNSQPVLEIPVPTNVETSKPTEVTTPAPQAPVTSAAPQNENIWQ